ncbi:MAG: hypothetical protein JKY37_17855 [Nannocystaceae bacterium]|nr:hypothetical protein [Nannocystaceae bacterium]
MSTLAPTSIDASASTRVSRPLVASFALASMASLALLLGGCDAEPEDEMKTGVGGKADDVDDGPEVGEEEGGDDVVEVDPQFAEALDVDVAEIKLDPTTDAPESYQRPGGLDVSLGGTEFWQRWSGGHSPTFSYSEGTVAGRKCMQASAIRFEAIMSDPPESVLKLKAETNWNGSFFNWNDDFTQSSSSASSSRLWAWRTGLIKWISQTSADDTCFLPTLAMVESLAANCLETAANNEGEIQGCRQ